MDLVFLGTGSGNGVPTFYCGCRVCREATENPACRRTRSAIALTGEQHHLFDAPPEISAQLLRERITALDSLFLTHAHHDHTAGLGDIALYVRLYRRERLPAFMSRETLGEVAARCGKLEDWLDVTLMTPGREVALDAALRVTALAASHSPGTLGYLMDFKGTRTAYLPDTGPLPSDTRMRLMGIDRLILDGTFWGDNWYPDEHLSVDAAIAEARALEVRSLYLTHLTLHYDEPVTCSELEEHFQPYGGTVNLAYDGTRLDLGAAEGP
jgi:phosphoribosyl 1,2-cyclic phosphate phosphodiesterase